MNIKSNIDLDICVYIYFLYSIKEKYLEMCYDINVKVDLIVFYGV